MICQADARRIPLADESVHCCITSPPFWNLRDYGLGNAGIGLEKTVEEYVANIVEVFREVWRVCRPDATVWCNMGDCYAASPKGSMSGQDKSRLTSTRTQENSPSSGVDKLSGSGLKPKDLVGIPWLVAFALQADGWYLRSDIIWHKPNPMPESVTDRPTKAHEYLFLLSKKPRYFYDSEAIREPHADMAGPVCRFGNVGKDGGNAGGRRAGGDGIGREPMPLRPGARQYNAAGRNRRDVWTIPTAPYRGAHFATFPPALVEPCILAGTSAKGVCPECGAPWERVIERPTPPDSAFTGTENVPDDLVKRGWNAAGGKRGSGQKYQNWLNEHPLETTGWRPTCDHGGDWRLVATPTGEVEDVDPTMDTGRAGMNRPRGQNEGRRPMYVWAQRAYAGQLQNSPHRLEMEQEAGSAFEHYIRTDESGARPVPPDLLAHWLENGWLTEPHEPPPPPDPVPAVVLDPFCGSGTVGQVCRLHGRRFVGLDLSMKYLRELALPRAEGTQAAGANADLPMFAPKGE